MVNNRKKRMCWCSNIQTQLYFYYARLESGAEVEFCMKKGRVFGKIIHNFGELLVQQNSALLSTKNSMI